MSSKRQASISSDGEPSRKRARGSGARPSDELPISRCISMEGGDAQSVVWPVPTSQLEQARSFLLRMAASAIAHHSLDPGGPSPILLLPDKDADGLCSGVILHRTLLRALGVPDEAVGIYHVSRGQHAGEEKERRAIEQRGARWIVILDQGSREGPGVVDAAKEGWEWDESLSAKEEAEKEREPGRTRVRSMVVDHHHLAEGETGPKGCLMVNASRYEPVPTAALLTWCICRPLWRRASREAGPGEGEEGHRKFHTEEETRDAIDYLALIGTAGDLGTQVKWDAPWPALDGEMKRWSKKRIGEVVGAINAPRRTPLFDIATPYASLFDSTSPLTVLDYKVNKHALRLLEARQEVAREVERCTHTPPKFSKDSRVALLIIHSPYQVHPTIATRWAGTLKGAKKLQAVFCANTGYADEPTATKEEGDEEKPEAQRLVHFSGRIAGAAKARGEDPSLIELLQSYAALDPTFLTDLSERQGGAAPSFARGHRQASGGILPSDFWRRFVDLMQIGVKPDPVPGESPGKGKGKNSAPSQANKLTSYFKPAVAVKGEVKEGSGVQQPSPSAVK